MPKISIIVPVYNVEKYLSRCIESILAQTFTDFELILVDDGSPDSCGKICDEYAEKDSRIKVVHKKNGGVSSARNAGLEAASGELVLFCDGDDYVAEQFCEYMQRAAAENAEAMVVCNGLKQAKENLEWRYMASEVADTYLTKQKSFYQIHKMLLSGSVCNKAFSLAKIRENGLTFNEKKPLGEDVAFAAEYCKLCEGITYIPTPLYRYVYNGGSAIRKYYPNLAELYLSIFK
ncbi:MAG: glycosyltransferase family 2 protein, partial [Clostridia bacterium]|nr:glycosyltransferase family 2 protein [Clostridia bacterium]